MSNVKSVTDLLQEYLDQIKRKAAEPINTVASEAAVLGISAGTLSQLRNGKPITEKVIAKIANTVAKGNKARRQEITEALESARQAQLTTEVRHDPLDDLDSFLETEPGRHRLICVVYRDIPQTRDQGDYPGYVDRASGFFKNKGLSLAMFQVFGPLEQIKENAKTAYDRDDIDAAENWNYVYKLASGVHEVFRKTVKAVANGSGPDSVGGQIVLYETARTPPLNVCEINSRLFYSYQLSEKGDERKIRIAQLIRGLDKELFVEFGNESAYQLAIAAQFQPVLRFWLAEGGLPTTNDQLVTHQENNDAYTWSVITET